MANNGAVIETSDLLLRHWHDRDIAPFAQLNSDERAMEYFLAPLSYQETVELYDRIQDEFSSHGFGVFAIEHRDSGAFVGCVGLHNVGFEADFTPAIEIMWRLLPQYWGNGYATQAARACLRYAKKELGFEKIVAFTTIANKRSERVMQKIGMTRVGEFDHPLVEANHPLCRHILYKTT